MSIVINTELGTWNRWIVCYVNCGSIQLRYEKKGKKRGTPLLNSVHSKTGTASFSAESDHCCEAVGPRLHAGRARVPASNLTLSLSCSGSSGWGSSTRKGSQFPLIRLWALALQPPVSHSQGPHVLARATLSFWHPPEEFLFNNQYCAPFWELRRSQRVVSSFQCICSQWGHVTGWLGFLLR